MSTQRTESQHPIRSAEVHVFEGVGLAHGRSIARFWPYGKYPVFFTGATAAEAEAQAEAFRTETIAKHEAAFAIRAEARAKARAARKAKSGTEK